MPEKANADYFHVSLRNEDETTRNTLSQFKREFEFYERSFNLAYDVVSYLYDLTKNKKHYSISKFAIFTTLPRLFGTMQSIRILALKGYYYDVAMLERSLIENFGLCIYLAENEEEARKWLRGKDIGVPKIKLVDRVLSLLSKETGEEGKAMYGKASNYVHASLRAIGPSFVTRTSASIEELRVDIQFPPFYRKKRVPHIAVYPTLLLIIVNEVFKDELKDRWANKIWGILREYTKKTKKS